MIEAQLLKISTEYTLVPIHKFKTVRKINKYTISDFIAKLSCESWDTIFNSEDVNTVFSSFLNMDIVKHCKEQGIEICALKLTFGTLNICVLTLYRVPSGNVSTF